MALIPTVRGEITAVTTDLTPEEATHGYYGQKVILRVISSRSLGRMVTPGTDIDIFVPGSESISQDPRL